MIRSSKAVPWTEWKIMVRIRSRDTLITDEGVLKYVQYRLGLRSKDSDCVVLDDVIVVRKSKKNVQEALPL